MSYILLIEDDPDIVRVVCTYLENEGYVVQVASNGLRGLETALNKPPKLIILDWMLPNSKWFRNSKKTSTRTANSCNHAYC